MIEKVKLSQLPAATTFDGLLVLGVDINNNGVKAPMSVLKGNKGDAATVAVSDTVLASAPGSTPAVVNEGTDYAAILKFTIPSGQNVEFQKSSTHIQWRVIGTLNWENLVPLTDIKGDNVSMQMSATHVQYQVGAAGWINLISIAALQQPAADATSAANTAAVSAYTVQLRLEALEQALIANYKATPTSMTLSYPSRITNRNRVIQKITSTLAPNGTGSNVLFLGDNNAITTFPNGWFTINKAGHSVINCIPTDNTAIYQAITIDVVEPSMRKVAASLRLLANGNIRLT